MPLFNEKRIAIILLAGCPWCPYTTRFVNKEIIFPTYGDFLITVQCMDNFKSPFIPYKHTLCWRYAYWRRLVLVIGQNSALLFSIFAWGQRHSHFCKVYFFACLYESSQWQVYLNVILITENHAVLSVRLFNSLNAIYRFTKRRINTRPSVKPNWYPICRSDCLLVMLVCPHTCQCCCR
jgi:hypothetical protein